MDQLPTLHLDVHDNFMKGHFVVQGCEKKFSLMGLDSIRILKEDGGPKGLYNQVEDYFLGLSGRRVGWDCTH